MSQVLSATDSSRLSMRAVLAPLSLLILFFALSLSERVQANEILKLTFWTITAGFAVWYALMLLSMSKNRYTPAITLRIRKSHYVQVMMHSSIFIYWGFYWPQVPEQAVLILAQLVFVTLIDVLLSWTRGQAWVFGFGRIPIIFSTNLFLWFKDDWFYYQFVMVAFGLFAKQMFTWVRDGQRVHIFNPSAISLAVASTILIFTNSTDISWGPAISNTLDAAPYMYVLIFMTGIVVQYLFRVTLVTLATALTLLVVGAIYYQATGVYFFATSDIPIAVFLGLHLLVTDPVTSPKTNLGKILFGIFYALSVMLLFEVLGAFGAPTFYDKLLSVPFLNASIILLDRLGRRIDIKALSNLFKSFNSYQLNLIHMAVWIVIFFSWFLSGHVSKAHPGREYTFWEHACQDDRRGACKNLFEFTRLECEKNNPLACAQLGVLYRNGRGVERDLEKAYAAVRRSCSMGFTPACQRLEEFRPK